MKGHDTLFSKASDEWGTPQWLFDMLNREFIFDCDAAATLENSLCDIMFTKGESDALTHHDWCGYVSGEDADTPVETFFLNPPHSKIAAFMKKAYEESLKGAVVVCLIPCRTDTRYWHNYVMMAHEIRFVMGRLKFGDSKNSAPFPSCVVIFDHSKYDKNNDPLFKTLKQPVKV
jgi:phage N-6-adenine-methyltransferase